MCYIFSGELDLRSGNYVAPELTVLQLRAGKPVACCRKTHYTGFVHTNTMAMEIIIHVTDCHETQTERSVHKILTSTLRSC